LKAPRPAAPAARRYRLDNRHCDGEGKNSDEKQVAVSQRNATAKPASRESAISSLKP
jgi:hypothetical protein